MQRAVKQVRNNIICQANVSLHYFARCSQLHHFTGIVSLVFVQLTLSFKMPQCFFSRFVSSQAFIILQVVIPYALEQLTLICICLLSKLYIVSVGVYILEIILVFYQLKETVCDI